MNDAGGEEGDVLAPAEWDGTLESSDVCSPHGWCWVALRPTSNAMLDVFGLGSNHVWAVGAGGTILEWNEGVVRGVSGALPGINFVSIHGSAADELWVVGLDGPLSLEGTERTPAAILRWDGTHFSEIPIAALGDRLPRDIWVRNETDVWVVGDRGLVARWNGSAWTLLDASTGADFVTVWGQGDDVWIGGDRWVHWDGTAWAHSGAEVLRDIGGDETVAAAGPTGAYTWNGTTFAAAIGGSYTTVTGVGSFTYWGSREQGVISRGGSVSVASSVPCTRPQRVWAVAPEEVYAASEGNLVGENCMLMRGDPSPSGEFTALVTGAPRTLGVALDEDVVYALGASEVLQGDGHTWTPVSTGIDVPRHISGSGVDDVWVVGVDGRSAHFDGTTWTPFVIELGATALRIAAARTEAWTAVGARVLRWDGTNWTLAHTLASPVRVIDVVDGEVWVQAGAVIERFDGTAWHVVPSLPNEFNVRRFTSATSGVWASGAPTAARFDGTMWHILPMLSEESEVFAFEGHVWASDITNAAYRYVGGEWLQYRIGHSTTGTARPFIGGGHVWMLLGNGLVRRPLD